MTYHQLMLENQQLLARKLLERVAEEGLSSGQPKVLEFLLEHDGCMQKEIAHACSVEAASVTSLLNKMERDGLVQRKIPQDNRRVSQVWLTEAGRQKAQMVRDTFTKLEEKLFQGFTSRERQSAGYAPTDSGKSQRGWEQRIISWSMHRSYFISWSFL